MAGFTLEKRIAAPLPTVFALFSDIPRTADRVRAVQRVEVLTEGPVRAGTRWRETRIVFRREDIGELEIVAMEPNSSYTVTGNSCGIHHQVEFRFYPDGDGTRVDVHFSSRPRTWLAKLTVPFGWLLLGSVKRWLDQDLEDLKAFIELQQGQPFPSN